MLLSPRIRGRLLRHAGVVCFKKACDPSAGALDCAQSRTAKRAVKPELLQSPRGNFVRPGLGVRLKISSAFSWGDTKSPQGHDSPRAWPTANAPIPNSFALSAPIPKLASCARLARFSIGQPPPCLTSRQTTVPDRLASRPASSADGPAPFISKPNAPNPSGRFPAKTRNSRKDAQPLW